ncbi:MAG: SHD1 domain-containing protein [Planctomycetota bacterium]
MTILTCRRRLLLACLIYGLLFTATFAEEVSRKWRDKSGKFEVEAKLLKHEDGKVELLKKDGKVITVPAAALSDDDQKYLKELADPMPNPFEGGAPLKEVEPEKKTASGQVGPTGLGLLTGSVNPVELATDGTAIFIDVEEPVPSLKPDPASVFASFREFIRPLEKLDAYAGTSKPLLVDPQGPTFAVSAHRNGNASAPDTFGRIYLIDGREKKTEVVINIEETLFLFDHHIGSGRSIAVQGVDSPSDRGGDIVLLNNLATGKPDAIARWRLPEWDKPGFKPKVEFARLLDGERAVVQVNSAVYIWDLVSGKSLFKIDRIVAGAKIEVSGGGKYLAIPASKGCRVIDTAAGELLGTVSFPSTLTPEVQFSPNGEQLALVAGNQLVVWNLASAGKTAEATIGNPTGVFFGWIGDKYLLTQLGGLLAPELGLTLWQYGLPSNNKAFTMDGGVAAIDKGFQMTTLLCLPVPHGAVERVARQLKGDDAKLMALRPGSEVALKIEAVEGVDKAEIEAGLQAAVEKAGWKVKNGAKVQIIAKIERGKTETLRFRTLGSAGSGASGETVNMKPYTASVEIRSGSDVLWSRSSTNMVPHLLRMEAGETLQQAVKRYEKADPAYFERLTIPPKILRPEIGKTVGHSRIDNGKWIDY